MIDWKETGKKFLFPRKWIVILLTVISAVSLTAIFLNGWEKTILAYVCYVVAFYTLVVICIICWKVIPRQYRTVKDRMHENKFMDRYLTDAVFKSNVGLYRSLTINLFYVVVNIISGYIYQTYWFGIFAVYYAIIAVMRFLLVIYVKKNAIGENLFKELKRARVCAYILLTLNLALSGAVLMMVYFDRGFNYQGFLIYVIALYTFYITFAAIRDMIKYRKYKSPVMSVTKVIKMTSALFSMLFLETAMFAQFGSETLAETKRIMIILTGAAISITVVSMAVYMIVKTSKEIKQYKCNKEKYRNGK